MVAPEELGVSVSVLITHCDAQEFGGTPPVVATHEDTKPTVLVVLTGAPPCKQARVKVVVAVMLGVITLLAVLVLVGESVPLGYVTLQEFESIAIALQVTSALSPAFASTAGLFAPLEQCELSVRHAVSESPGVELTTTVAAALTGALSDVVHCSV